MAEENKVDLLMSVDLDASETLKTIAALRTETADLRKEQKELDRTTAEGAVEFERLNTQIKANTKTIQQYEKQIVNNMVVENQQAGYIERLRANLSNAKIAYAALTKEEQESAKGRELLDKTAALNAELKDLESAYGDNQRKVGEYENATKSLRTEMRELTETLATMLVNGQDSSEEFKTLSGRLAELRDAVGDINAQTNQMASDTSAFDTMVQGVQAVTAAYGVWKSTSAALGIENEAFEKTMQQMVVVMGALQSLTTLQNLAQKQSNIYRAAANILQKIGVKQTAAEVVATSSNVVAIQAEAVAENASTVAKTKGAVVTALLTAKQWLWNAAMSANPVLILVAGVMALIAGISALIGWLSKESKAAQDAKTAREEYNTALEESEKRLKDLENAHKNSTREAKLAAREQVEALRAAGADEQKIRDVQAAGETKLRDLEIEYQKQRQKETQDLIALKQKELQYWIEAQSKVKEGGEKWEKYAESIKEAEAALADLKASLDDADLSIRETMQDQTEAARQQSESTKQAAKERTDAAKSALDARIAAFETELTAQKKYNEAFLKAEKDYQSTDLRVKQDYARRLFDLNADAERARLDNLRKNNRISEAEYKRSLEIMAADRTTFNNGQVAETNTFFDSERKAILGMLTQTLDEQIAETEAEYADALKRLGDLEEEATLDQIQVAIRLEEEKNAKIEQLRKSALANQIKQIEDANKEAFASDLAQYQNNERDRLAVLEKSLQAQIAAKKAAGIETYNEEAQLENLAIQRTALNLNNELLLANSNAKKIRDAKVKSLNEQAAIYADNADEQLRIAKELADAERELIDARIEKFMEWRDTAMELFDGFNSLMSNGLDAQLQKVQETYDAEKQALADKYAAHQISEAQYNREMIKLDQQKAKEEAKIERQRAIRERAGKVFSVATDTAVAVMASFKNAGGFPLGIWAASAMAAIGALNLATILSEPLPKAARGGLISGPSHARGGTIIEAEGGEAIMTRRAVSLFGPVLSALNEMGGGVPFARPLSDGGYTLRAAGSSGATADEIADALKNVQIVTLIEDVNRGQEQFAKIEARGTVFE